ncbi:unnamed protein product, partial [Ectocarpus sp. 12 AP-2014]
SCQTCSRPLVRGSRLRGSKSSTPSTYSSTCYNRVMLCGQTSLRRFYPPDNNKLFHYPKRKRLNQSKRRSSSHRHKMSTDTHFFLQITLTAAHVSTSTAASDCQQGDHVQLPVFVLLFFLPSTYKLKHIRSLQSQLFVLQPHPLHSLALHISCPLLTRSPVLPFRVLAPTAPARAPAPTPRLHGPTVRNTQPVV